MTIICLEGASAVGKSTACQRLTQSNPTIHVVPEVIELFQRPSDAEPNWYYDRQIDRFNRAQSHSQNGSIALLDGDIFQPIWYNHFFPKDFPPHPALNFFEKALDEGILEWPSAYIVLTADDETLTRQKQLDHNRSRRNFARNLSMVPAHTRYFEALSNHMPVYFIETGPIEPLKKRIENCINSIDTPKASPSWSTIQSILHEIPPLQQAD